MFDKKSPLKISYGKINLELYDRKRYFYMHRLQVAVTSGTTIFVPGILMFLFPEITLFIWLFVITLGISLLFLGYVRTIGWFKRGTLISEYDIYYKKRFYEATMRFSTLLILLSFFAVVNFDSFKATLEMPFFKLTRIYIVCLLVLFFNSIYMLKSAFDTGPIEALRFWK